MHAKGVNIPIPSTEEIISIVCISSEASKIASMEKCFTIIDKESQ
jgi:sugar diacid utilization regulator